MRVIKATQTPAEQVEEDGRRAEIEQNRADLIYIAAMAGVDLPEDEDQEQPVEEASHE
jgi:hypothetical protein